MKKTAIIAGASGLVGRELISVLIADPGYEKIIVLVRTRIEGRDSESKFHQIVTDWNPEQLEQALRGELKQADVFCALGTTIKKAGTQEQFREVDYEYPMILGNLAKKYGARQFLVVSAMGAKRDSKFFYSRVKGDLEHGLSKLGLRTLRIFRPSLLLGDREEEFRFGEKAGAVAAKAFSFLMAGGLRKYRPIPAQRVAAGMAEAAKQKPESIRIYESHQI
ncbi:NAD(P)H-binding protein [Paenibacillus chitinolyticus]|uniref:NAD(P)H-binding protein n=1 Tax=Paenibacillus chitinolyticus TaxID=79263 RepID=UPI0026E4EB8A|nr:NAD(P)H-binding protein [Paenibacillus chitinolyticus]GKS14708.1 nucleoside-diphosphate sugar epimerase [Paenibacillus chitinolyticus]